MSDYFVGIDPGISGAVVIFRKGKGKAITIHDTPTAEVKKGKKYRNVYLHNNMFNLLRDLPIDTNVWLEDVHAMPKNGGLSSFGMGYGKGIWMGILAAMKIEPTLVSPQRWKRHFNLLGEDKDAARIKAIQLYPALMPMLKLKKNIDRADAMLIMRYGMESLGYEAEDCK